MSQTSSQRVVCGDKKDFKNRVQTFQLFVIRVILHFVATWLIMLRHVLGVFFVGAFDEAIRMKAMPLLSVFSACQAVI